MANRTPNTVTPPLDYASPSTPAHERLRPCVSAVLGIGAAAITVLLGLGAIESTLRPRCCHSSAMACAANIRSIGQAVQLYAAEHAGDFPDTLADLHTAGYVRDVRIFTCPSSDDTAAVGTTPEARAADVSTGGHLSYVYLGRGLDTKARPDVVLAFEWPSHHVGERVDGTNVLFADGRVERLEDPRPILDQFAAGLRPVHWPARP